jgi:hypothetical protein
MTSMIGEYNRRLDTFVSFKNEDAVKDLFNGRDASTWSSYTRIFETINDDLTLFNKKLSALSSFSKTMDVETIDKQNASIDTMVRMIVDLFGYLARWTSLLYEAYPEMWRIVSGILIYHSPDIGAHDRNDNPFNTVEDVLRYSDNVSQMKVSQEDVLERAKEHQMTFSRYVDVFSKV